MSHRTLWAGIAMVVLIAANISAQIDDNDYYAFFNNEKYILIASSEYIAISIAENDFPGDLQMLNEFPELDREYGLAHIFRDLYVARIRAGSNVDYVIENLRDYPGITDVNNAFLNDDGQVYYLYPKILIAYKTDVSDAIIDSIEAANNLIVLYNPGSARNTYIYGSENSGVRQMMAISNGIYENGLAYHCGVDYISPMTLSLVPNDTYYEDEQYYLCPDRTDFESAFDYQLTDTIINVTLLDSGLEPHDDLPASRIAGGFNYHYEENDYRFYEYDLPDICYPNQAHDNAHYHGISVAGLLAATINDTQYIAGATNNLSITMHKIFDCEESGSADGMGIMRAIRDAADNGAAIISNSWAYTSCSGPGNYIGYYVNNAINYARDTMNCLVVFATGNCFDELPCDTCVLWPSGKDNVFAVGASDSHHVVTRWEYSHYDADDSKVDVVAPGQHIITLDQMGPGVGYWKSNSSIPCADDYNIACFLDGTSLAAPLVSGLAARIMARRPEFIGNPDTVEYIIKNSTGNGWHDPPYYEDTIVVSNEIGYGRINAARAMLAISHGDVNNDVNINLLDISFLISYIYEDGPEPFPNLRLGDANCSGTINLLDITYLISYLYDSPPGPPPPTCFKY